tara:strand:+ start:16 stop:156 length:141 start_codon:yes stop_codon:yes gene_type:complete
MNDLEKHIRCKCGKYYGIRFFRQQKVCKRCKTIVIARGEKNEQKTL